MRLLRKHYAMKSGGSCAMGAAHAARSLFVPRIWGFPAGRSGVERETYSAPVLLGEETTSEKISVISSKEGGGRPGSLERRSA